jgi:sugar phosphate isomerase/epimerase
MKLGMIAPVSEESFRHARDLGLDFLEFCINGGEDVAAFLSRIAEIKGWMAKYGVGVGSVGRWKTNFRNGDGEINEEELVAAKGLMEAAAALGSPNYVCGCNYCDAMSKFMNYVKAVEWFEKLLAMCPEGVAVSAYNCWKTNFIDRDEAWSIVLGHLPDLGIKYDPAHSRQGGRDYLKEMADWGHRIRHVHLKGTLLVDGRRLDDPPAGLDNTDWVSMLSILRSHGYDGNLSIEPHSPIWTGELGEKGLRYTVEYMRKLML